MLPNSSAAAAPGPLAADGSAGEAASNDSGERREFNEYDDAYDDAYDDDNDASRNGAE